MSLWTAIETAPQAASFFAWKLRFGGELEKLAPWFLKRTNETARTVPCPDHCGCLHQVTEEGFGVCDCGDCEDIPLTREDVQVWEANWTGLGNRVRDALQLEHKAAVFAVRNVWQIGAFGGDAVQVVLVVQPERGAFNEAIAQLVARVTGPFVVVTPTAAHDDIASRELLGRAGAHLMALAPNVTLMHDGRLVATQGAREFLSGLLPKPIQDVSDEALRRAYALIVLAAKEQPGNQEAPLKDVFDLYCMQDLSSRQVAARLKCSKATIINRLGEIERLCGVVPAKLRTHKPFFERMEKDLADPRARRLRRKDAAYGDDPTEERD